MTLDPELAVAIPIAFATAALCWWVGFRWRSFLLLGLGAVLGTAIGRGLAGLFVEPGWFSGLVALDYSVNGLCIGGGATLLSLIAFHVTRRRRQVRRIDTLTSGEYPRETTSINASAEVVHLDDVQLEDAMADVEARAHVKFVPCGGSAPTYEDWVEVIQEPEAMTDAYLLVPHRTRVRSPAGSSSVPRLSNVFDCIVLLRTPTGSFDAIPASKSGFCERAMTSLRAAVTG